jgi:hypothetical protein
MSVTDVYTNSHFQIPFSKFAITIPKISILGIVVPVFYPAAASAHMLIIFIKYSSVVLLTSYEKPHRTTMRPFALIMMKAVRSAYD